ncbi:hypothetical protein HYU11_01885 [Candidatus Woesearchaeota archaeon]|nr:hypothetical protein [Candidatus Woesearchaeota archaeon]
MDSLAIIHLREEYAVDTCVYRELYRRILSEVETVKKQGGIVQFLADFDIVGINSENVPLEFRNGDFEFVGTYGSYLCQFLVAKKRIIDSRVTTTTIAGISYSVCVPSFLTLLQGENPFPDLSYESALIMLNWPEKEFFATLKAKLKGEINDGLTDSFCDKRRKSKPLELLPLPHLLNRP